jgi:hypothetical protein
MTSTAYKATIDGGSRMVDPDAGSLLVRIWDLGPRQPMIPDKPDLPEGKEGSPAHDLAMIEFESALENYKTALKAYGAEKKAFAEWHKTYAGPYQFETHSVNAREAIQIEPERYVAELPKGRKPGKWHQDNLQHEAEQRRTFAQIVARDPIFGSQGAPA